MSLRPDENQQIATQLREATELLQAQGASARAKRGCGARR